MVNSFNFFSNILGLILVVAIYLIPINSYSSEVRKFDMEENEVIEIIKLLNEKKNHIKTAVISGKVFYNLPKDKKIKLYKTYKIRKESKIHIDIYILIRIKVAEFISDGLKVQYKRIKKKTKRREASNFNLNIFNKNLDFDLTVEELNNMLLGLSLKNLSEDNVNYKIIEGKLYLSEGSMKIIININTKEIEKILIEGSRKAEITFENYTNLKDYSSMKLDRNGHYYYDTINLNSNHKIRIPLKITLSTPTFSMKIRHENDIIINKEIMANELIIDEKEN